MALGPAKQRTVLAALLVDIGRPVPVETLIDRVWGEEPPKEARNTLYAHVTRIRRLLGAAVGDGRRMSVERHSNGYLLNGDADAVDLHRYRSLVAQTRSPSLSAERQAAVLREAVGLWKGEALAGLPGTWALRLREQLAQQHLNTVILWARAEMCLGRQGEVVEPLRELAQHHQLVEPLAGELMRALYLDGRHAEALDHFTRTRAFLLDELGTEPGLNLRRVHEAVLRGTLDRPAPVQQMPASAGTHHRVPMQLLPDIAGFVGRDGDLKRLDALLPDQGEDITGTLVITVVSGTAGVGKTTLAVHWAHSVRGRFQGGQLYVNLDGFAPTPPMRPIDALSRFLHALGVPAEEVPADQEEAAALYRSLLAGKRVLVLLDNARSPEQVRPLLPAAPGSMALITSRNRLSGLVAREGASRLTLDRLTVEEARDLLCAVLGKELVEAEPDAAAALAEACGRLPLALRIAAANLIDHPQRSIAAHVADLTAGDRLATLEVEGDEQTAVRGAFDQSYAALDPDARRLFRLAGLIPGRDVTAHTAAALTGAELGTASRLLDRLASAHLIEQHAPGRFAFHDLLRLYAIERADKEEEAEERTAAVRRVLRWYLRTADTAAQLVYPQKLRLPQGPEPAGSGPEAGFDDRKTALAWLDDERFNLADTVAHAAEHGPRPAAWRLADTLRGYYWLRMHTVDWLAVAQAGLKAAEADGDLPGQGAAQLSLGDVHRCLSLYHQAIDHYAQARALNEQAAWLDGQAAALGNLGNTYERAGRLQDAAETHRKALDLDQRTGRLAGQAASLANLGSVHREMGQLRTAGDYLAQALELDRKIGSRAGEAMDLTSLGETCHALGQLHDARIHLSEALTIHREEGDRDFEAETLRALAGLNRDTGRLDEAREQVGAALAQARETGNRRIEADTLNTLATIHQRRGRSHDAVDTHQQALDLARDTGERYPEAAALIGLATSCTELGRIPAARAHAQQGLGLAQHAGYRFLEAQAATALAASLADEPEAAREHAERALALHREIGHPSDEAITLRGLDRTTDGVQGAPDDPAQ
ncbi:tetratricopeptide repeat protein [Actinacidiphila glaucinigra]|uniref:AfsR/SARP family transcriptional regulator n=1 Tax=Actinacidiphila glaucinigra TaxID=235986 RepID=UPI00324EDD00